MELEVPDLDIDLVDVADVVGDTEMPGLNDAIAVGDGLRAGCRSCLLHSNTTDPSTRRKRPQH